MPVSERREFWRIRHEKESIPRLPGVYVLFGDHLFDYPGGKSPVFYIGQSTNLRDRLYTHWRCSEQARSSDRREALYLPRYEYAATYGYWYAFGRTWQGMTAKALEEKAMACFARRFRAFPVGKGAGSWSRIDTVSGDPAEG